MLLNTFTNVPEEDQGDFVPLAPITPVAYELDPRQDEVDKNEQSQSDTISQ